MQVDDISKMTRGNDAVEEPNGSMLSEVFQWHLTDRKHVEADLVELLAIQHVAAVEDECRLLHALEDAFVVKSPERVPLGDHGNRVGAFGRLVRVRLEDDGAVDAFQVGSRVLERLGI